MDEFKEERKPKTKKASSDKVTPLKDFEIHFNDIHIVLKKGEPISVPAMFLANLKTEKVIK